MAPDDAPAVPVRSGATRGTLHVGLPPGDTATAPDALTRLATREVLEHLPVGYAETTVDGIVLDVNERLCRMTGYSREELIGSPSRRIAEPVDQPTIDVDTANLLAGRVSSLVTSRTYRTASGGRLPVVVRSAVKRDADGRPISLVGLLHDDSERRAAQEELGEAHRELARREEFLGALLEALPVGVLAADAEGSVTLTNRAFVSLRSANGRTWSPQDFHTENDDLFDAADPDGPPIPNELLPLRQALAGCAQHDRTLLLRPPGTSEQRRLWTSARPVRGSDGESLGAVAVFSDVTEMHAQAEALRASEQRWHLGFLSSPQGMAVVSEDGVVLEVNDALCSFLGRTQEDVLHRSASDVMLPADAAKMRSRLREASERASAAGWRSERRYVRPDGRVVTGLVSAVRVVGADGVPVLLVQVDDVTRQREVEAELSLNASLDALTRVLNRASFDQQLAAALTRASRTGAPLAVLVINLDSFGLVNEAVGHAAGDDALRIAAERVRRAVRPQDLVARHGGDEFIVACEECDDATATTVADRIASVLAEPATVGGQEVALAASVGVTVHRPGDVDADVMTPQRLLLDADAAMVRAKRAGKNRHAVFSAQLRQEGRLRAEMTRALEDALAGDAGSHRLEVHYQPVIELQSGRLVGVEALVRLRAHDGTLVPPARFIPLAESSGLVLPLGQRVLREAAVQTARWHSAGYRDLHVAVNVSAVQAAPEGFDQSVLAALHGAGLPPAALVVELTESALLDASPRTMQALRSLREHGVGIAIDDFGTAYASLSYLQQLPVSELKIDLSFVRGLPDGRAERAIVNAVAGLAEALDLSCVAEGIETAEQCAYLTRLGVLGQGYLLGRPMSADDLTARLGQA